MTGMFSFTDFIQEDSKIIQTEKNSGLTRNGQRAKKVVSDSPRLVESAIGLVNSVINLPDGQVIFFEEIE